jgi:Activator of Hsp90 ATPase homolog 1-like protein
LVGGQTVRSQDFSASFTVERTPQEAFAAINNVRGWWSGEIEGGTDKPGDVFTYRYKDVHYSKQRITEFVPGKKVVWLILDSFLSFVDDKTEWNGTKVTFEVSKKGDKTEVHFTHVGLVPEYECYGACSNAWSFYINGSLRKLIMTGKGEPNKKEKPGRNASRSQARTRPRR